MLRPRPVHVVVFLCFVCSLALRPQPAARPCSQDVLKRSRELLSKAPNLKWLECRLYTPNITDFKNCPSSTLKCFADEIKVLIEEWETVGEVQQNFKFQKKLEKLASKFNQTETLCRKCEHLAEEDAETFLRGLVETLERMNSQYC